MNDTNTPETDDLRAKYKAAYGESAFVDSSCVDELLMCHERLERERDEARREAEAFRDATGLIQPFSWEHDLLTGKQP